MKRFLFILSTLLILFSCCDILQKANTFTFLKEYEADYDRDAFTQKQGPIPDSEIVINGEKIPNTSSSVIIPEGYHENIESTNTDHLYLENDYEKASDNYKGAFPPKRKVRLTAFEMSQYEVTQQLYKAVMGNESISVSKGQWDSSLQEYNHYYAPLFKNELYPVIFVNFTEAIIFCNKLTEITMGKEHCVYFADKECTTIYTYEHARIKEGMPANHSNIPDTTTDPDYDKNWDNNNAIEPYMDITKKGYRLPTEAEWEYAARGGNPTAPEWNMKFGCTDNISDIWWDEGNMGIKAVNTKEPNTLGLYNMCGNVTELCWDKDVKKWGTYISNGNEKDGYIYFEYDDDKYLDKDNYILNPQGSTKSDEELEALAVLNDINWNTSTYSYHNGRVSKGGAYYTLDFCCYVFYKEFAYYKGGLSQVSDQGFRICRTL